MNRWMIYCKCAALLACCVIIFRQQTMMQRSDETGVPLSSSALSKVKLTNGNNRNRGYKPNLVFYVGLPKTATSFMQCTLCSHLDNTNPILLQDNYVFIGTCPYQICGVEKLPPDMLFHGFTSFFTNGQYAEEGMAPKLHTQGEQRTSATENAQQTSLSHDFILRVNEAYRDGHDALIIFEGAHVFPDAHIETLAAYLESMWTVHIVVGYRPLYEWLPSKYNSVFKHQMVDTWPKDRSKGVRSFDIDDRGRFTEIFNEIAHVYHMHPTAIVRDNYQRHFSRTVLIMGQPPMAEATGKGDPILEQLFCHIVPDAPNVCRSVLVGDLEFPTAKNPSISLSEDRLALVAYWKGILAPSLNNGKDAKYARRVVRDAIREHYEQLHHENGYQYPQQCWPSAKLDKLEQLSLDLERELFKDCWKLGEEEAHRNGFAKAVVKNKFCHVAAYEALQEPEWQSFFASDKFQQLLVEDSSDNKNQHV